MKRAPLYVCLAACASFVFGYAADANAGCTSISETELTSVIAADPQSGVLLRIADAEAFTKGYASTDTCTLDNGMTAYVGLIKYRNKQRPNAVLLHVPELPSSLKTALYWLDGTDGYIATPFLRVHFDQSGLTPVLVEVLNINGDPLNTLVARTLVSDMVAPLEPNVDQILATPEIFSTPQMAIPEASQAGETLALASVSSEESLLSCADQIKEYQTYMATSLLEVAGSLIGAAAGFTDCALGTKLGCVAGAGALVAATAAIASSDWPQPGFCIDENCNEGTCSHVFIRGHGRQGQVPKCKAYSPSRSHCDLECPTVTCRMADTGQPYGDAGECIGFHINDVKILPSYQMQDGGFCGANPPDDKKVSLSIDTCGYPKFPVWGFIAVTKCWPRWGCAFGGVIQVNAPGNPIQIPKFTGCCSNGCYCSVCSSNTELCGTEAFCSENCSSVCVPCMPAEFELQVSVLDSNSRFDIYDDSLSLECVP